MINYRDYINSRRWKNKRKAKIKESGHFCNKCGSVRFLQVHHLTYERLGNELLEDLEILCDNCHRLEHGLPVTKEDREKVKKRRKHNKKLRRQRKNRKR